jgi:formylglycine-generating enzyme required for sulfatase activity
VTSKFALVIANTEYQDASFAKLTAPGKDAEEFAYVLREPELAAFDNVQVLLNEGEGKTRRFIARFFAERKRDDLLLLYFSGHGVRNGQGQLFLAANDTEISILEATGIPAEFVTYAMNNSRSQRQLLILDCCNSGAFAHGSKSASAVGKSMGIAHVFEGSGFGRVVLTATDATQYAWEGNNVIGDTQKSVFTHFLIEGLKGDADQNRDGRIDVDELYDYAYEEVVQRTPKQTPGKWSYRQQGDLILRENLKPRQVKPTPLPSDLLELLSYPNFSVRRAAIQDLIPFLDGKHLGLARAAEEKLREITTSDASFDLRKLASDALNAHGFIAEPLAPAIEVLQESVPVEKPVPVKPRKKISSKPVKSLDEHDTKHEQIAEMQSAPVEIPKKERKKEKAAPLLRESSSLEQFSAFLSRIARAPREILVERKIALPKLDTLRLGRILGLSLIVFFLGWAGKAIISNMPAFNSPALPTATSTTPNTTATIQLGTTPTSQLARINTPSPTQTSITATPTLGIGSTMTGEDGMTLLYVPARDFTMGSDYGGGVTKPVHIVTVDTFWIDQTEVTNKQYTSCVSAGVCLQPLEAKSPMRSSYYADPQFQNYPVIYVDWYMAKAYCEWAGRRLPTEAEWEKAARGTDGYIYPWGNNAPNDTLLNYNSPNRDTTEVGKYPDGQSPYGAYDMAGNVWEWVSSLHLPYPYDKTDGREDLAVNSDRILRGGAWYHLDGSIRPLFFAPYDRPDDVVRADMRNWFAPKYENISEYGRPPFGFGTVGFRCAMSASP